MNLKRYTEKAQEAVLAAQQLADRSGHPEIDPEHLLRALVDQQDGVVPSVLRIRAEPTRCSTAIVGGRPRTESTSGCGSC